MKRRKFLSVGTTGVITTALIGFPSYLKAQDSGTRVVYNWNEVAGIKGLELSIDHKGVQSLANASADQKRVTLKQIDGIDIGTATYKIVSSRIDFSALKTYKVEIAYQSGAATRNGLFESSTLAFTLLLNAQIELKDPTTGKVYTLEKGEYGSGDEVDCFLTTACVHHQGLSDDGVELNTLRAFREEYMRPKAAGQALLDRYYVDGPVILQAVNEQANPGAYYEHMYQHLVRPSLALIEQGQSAATMAYYRDYVLAIKTHLQLR